MPREAPSHLSVNTLEAMIFADEPKIVWAVATLVGDLLERARRAPRRVRVKA